MSAQTDQIRAMFDRFTAAWKTNDGPTVAGFFAEDGSLINPFGQRAEGRPAVAAMYTEYFGSLLRGTSTTVTVGNIRPVEDGHAFVDAEQTITGSDGNVVLAIHLAALLRRDRDAWSFVDARPYSFASVPG